MKCVPARDATASATASSEVDPSGPAGPGPAASASASNAAATAPLSTSASVGAVASAAPSGSASASASVQAPAAGKPARVEVGDPKFTTGDVPKAKASLEKLSKKLKACVDEHGGLTGASGELELQFLVRAAGIAEGVEVLRAKGIADDAKKCVRDLMKKKAIGTPSEDPVGVTVVLKLTAT
ncbi:MAG: hypothetical protein IPM79_04795 [Polyangiaceae bacterium]|nr:hypothetical protein [Polyangiaceae bacterium]